MRAKTYRLNRPAFILTVLWATPETEAEAICTYLNRQGYRTIQAKDLAGAAAMTYSVRYRNERKRDGDDHWVVILPPDSTPGIVAHEATHLANRAFLFNGWKHTRKNDEAFASTVGDIVDLIEKTRP